MHTKTTTGYSLTLVGNNRHNRAAGMRTTAIVLLWKTARHFLWLLKIHRPHRQHFHSDSLCTDEPSVGTGAGICTSPLATALVITAQRWKQHNCLSEPGSRMHYMRLPALPRLRKKEHEDHTCHNLEDIVLRERYQS